MEVYIHGNCQSSVLRKTLSECNNDIIVNNYEVHAINIEQQITSYTNLVRRADFIISQPIGDRYRDEPRLSTKWIKDNMRKEARLITFVPLHFLAYFPHLGYIPGINSLKMPYFDFNIVLSYINSLNAEQTISLLEQDDLYSADLLEQEVDLAIGELKRRENACQADLIISDLISDSFRSELLFFTHNHPTRRLAVRIAHRLAAMLDLSTTFAVDGKEYLDGIVLSPYQNTALYFGLDLGIYDQMIRGGGVEMTRSAYIERCFLFFDQQYGRDRLRDEFSRSKDGSVYLQKIGKKSAGEVATLALKHRV